MALGDKMKHLADRINTVPKTLETSVDLQMARVDQIEQRGGNAMSRLKGVVDDMDKGVGSLEDTVNQLSNAVPE